MIPFGQILGCPGTEVDGSMVRIDGLFQLLSKWDILGLFHPLILTFDPNFQRDIKVDMKICGVVWGTTHLDIQML